MFGRQNNRLDITSLKSKERQHLQEQILHGVRDTQRYVIQPYPDEILMTKQQFDLLRPNLMAVPGEEHMYRTPYNIMEVRVKT